MIITGILKKIIDIYKMIINIFVVNNKKVSFFYNMQKFY